MRTAASGPWLGSLGPLGSAALGLAALVLQHLSLLLDLTLRSRWRCSQSAARPAMFALGMVEEDRMSSLYLLRMNSILICNLSQPQSSLLLRISGMLLLRAQHTGCSLLKSRVSRRPQQQLAKSVLEGAKVVQFGNNAQAQQLAQQYWKTSMKPDTPAPWQSHPPQQRYVSPGEQQHPLEPMTRSFSQMPTLVNYSAARHLL